jgi:alkylation response protein AidB-like acyl-CoA dehydrogenase
MPMQLAMQREVADMIDAAKSSGVLDDPLIRQRLVDAYIGVNVMRSSNLRVVADLLNDSAAEPGKATAAAATGSKLFASLHHQRMGELALDVYGADAVYGTAGAATATARKLFLLSRAETIYGGTSEIQRNIIAERVLGLPRA